MDAESSCDSMTCGSSANTETVVPCQEFAGAESARPPLVDYLDRTGMPVPIPDSNPEENVKIRFGEYGYFGPCQDGNLIGQSDFHNRPCDPGYFDVGRCGRSDNQQTCNDFCPLHNSVMGNCPAFRGSSRRVCQRLERDFETVRNGTTLSTCCSLSRTAAREYDCPYHIYKGSPVCTDRSALVEQCLVGIPVTGQPPIPPNVLGTDCHLLWQQGTNVNPTRELYIERMLQACQGNNITHPACVNLMREDPDNTQLLRDYLTQFCGKPENIGNPDYGNMCACFYPDSFYQKLREGLARFYQIPQEYLNLGGRSCIYRPCAESPIQYEYADQQCGSRNISVCTQSISVTANGLENVDFKQDCGFNRRVFCDPECVAPLTCVDGDCVDKQACTADVQCGTLYECKAGRCAKKPEGMKWYFKAMIALAAIACVVFLGFGVKKLISARKSKTP